MKVVYSEELSMKMTANIEFQTLSNCFLRNPDSTVKYLILMSHFFQTEQTMKDTFNFELKKFS